MLPLLEWFRDEDGWTSPDGRRGELVELLVGLPVFAVFATRETGVPSPTEHSLAVLLGVCCGFCYAVYWRERIRLRPPRRGVEPPVSLEPSASSTADD